MKRTLLAAAASMILSTVAANAALLGITNGPDDAVDPVNFLFENDSGFDILNLTIDGTTAVGDGTGPNSGVTVFWDSIASLAGDANPNAPTPVDPFGLNSPVMTFLFAPGAFATGFTFDILDIDPDFGGVNDTGVQILDLIGVKVTAFFSDSSTFVGAFVDDPEPGKGLKLEGSTTGVVPLPAALPLMLAGLGAFALVSRRRRKAA
ncbi:hypothetical protein ROA7450_02730 [Roseovarius albus]|uniref:VPLPA-CTERM protein sorting domain protein n=1 Tax=Roseovarius albus TaxID=1247867 RepID=A0A1X6ZJP9_9RHOB|nr:VPLPA-CTERM sorting domain-containing protein [Roseovarius albus]SLN53375.1 hypothetical protein ROA7450_02730 [Roseovarius albus]